MSSDSESSRSEEEEVATITCRTMRRKIKTFLATKEMTQTAWLKEIGCNSHSYQRFMRLKGDWNGTQNGVYWGAQRFFKKYDRQKKAQKASGKRKRRDDDDDDVAPVTKRPSRAAQEAKLNEVMKISLDDERVFDSCDEVRTKILQYLTTEKVSKAAFARMLGVTAAPLTKFLDKTGKRAGAGSQVFPEAYKFFERLRIKNDEPKTAARKRNEKQWPDGVPLKDPPTRFWMPMSMSAAENKKFNDRLKEQWLL